MFTKVFLVLHGELVKMMNMVFSLFHFFYFVTEKLFFFAHLVSSQKKLFLHYLESQFLKEK